MKLSAVSVINKYLSLLYRRYKMCSLTLYIHWNRDIMHLCGNREPRTLVYTAAICTRADFVNFSNNSWKVCEINRDLRELINVYSFSRVSQIRRVQISTPRDIYYRYVSATSAARTRVSSTCTCGLERAPYRRDRTSRATHTLAISNRQSRSADKFLIAGAIVRGLDIIS